ncbi:MAG: FixH family protein [Bacteroidales bacterium]|jgi:hypothetical protein|nr:FixH family protein [Bacteroidales bacterium]
MKAIRLYNRGATLVILFSLALFASCGKDDEPENPAVNPVEGLKKIHEFADDSYIVTAWNETGEFRLGYTKVYFTVQDKDGKYIDNAQLTAFPEMDMGMMKHSTPRSEITKVPDKPLYEAYYNFLMYSGQGDGVWYYDLAYTVGSASGIFEDEVIDVKNAFRPDGRTQITIIKTVVGTDDKRYVLTLVEPLHPKVGVNDITVYIHKSQSPEFPPIEGGLILKLDPRMPSMENHSSPNNVDLTWNAAEKIYKGKVNFSMTGYWKLNLILQDASGNIVYGNPVVPQGEQGAEASSLFFEVEF